jgi:hypothetical protein
MPWLSVFTVLGKGRVSIRSGSKISKPHGSWWHNQGSHFELHFIKGIDSAFKVRYESTN